MKAVVALDINKASVEDVELHPPQSGEVMLRMAAVGVCHSDLSVINGTVPMPLPMVIGHEGAGTIAALGPDVTGLSIGDRVVLSFVPSCGQCYFCQQHEPHLCVSSSAEGRMLDGSSRLFLGDQALGAMSQLGCMAEYAVVPAASVAQLHSDIPMDRAALLGCGVMTGVGAVTKTAKVQPGSTVAVLGCGGVGLAVIQGAQLVGARRIIAIDRDASKLDHARHFGATHTILAEDDVCQAVQDLTDGWGVDYSFEVTGNPTVMELACEVARRGGTVCIVGVGHYTEFFKMNACAFAPSAKKLLGCFYGNANFRVDIPNMLELYQQKRLDLDSMVSKTYVIDEALAAFADLEAGLNARGVIVFE